MHLTLAFCRPRINKSCTHITDKVISNGAGGLQAKGFQQVVSPTLCRQKICVQRFILTGVLSFTRESIVNRNNSRVWIKVKRTNQLTVASS